MEHAVELPLVQVQCCYVVWQKVRRLVVAAHAQRVVVQHLYVAVHRFLILSDNGIFLFFYRRFVH